MNIDKILKLHKKHLTEDAIKEFSDTINPEKYITKANILKLIDRDKNKKLTNLENIKDEDKILAYIFIEQTLNLYICDIEHKINSLIGTGIDDLSYLPGDSNGVKIYKTLYSYVCHKYSSLILSIYDEINNLNNTLSNFSKKYNVKLCTYNDDSVKLRINTYNGLFSRDSEIEVTFDNLDKLVKSLPELDKKLESWFEFTNKVYKDISKYEEIKTDKLFNNSENIHDTKYTLNAYCICSNINVIEYSVRLTQEYHEKYINLIYIKDRVKFKDDEYINKLDSINIEEIIDNIKLNDGKPYEYEVTIENLPISSSIKKVIDKDSTSSSDGNFYVLTNQINNSIYINITDYYNCGNGCIGIVMSVFSLNKDFDINDYLMKLKNLYFNTMVKNIGHLDINSEKALYDSFDNAIVTDLGQSHKELVKLL